MNVKEIVLQHGSRGMDYLKGYIPDDIYKTCAASLLKDDRKVALITTGFFVKNSAETDGPPGAYFLYLALQKLGYEVKLLVDPIVYPLMCKHVGYEVLINMPLGDEVDTEATAQLIREDLNPSVIISTERCGRASDGKYKNMSGIDIGSHTAKIDEVFQILDEQSFSIAIGDGGNEIGMGNLTAEINRHLDLDPCQVTVDTLLIATVSNWGVYGLIAELASQVKNPSILPCAEAQYDFVKSIVSMGAVNGMSGIPECIVDGFDSQVEKQIMSDLSQYIAQSL